MPSDISSGTGGGLVTFLGWAIDKSELPAATASAMRTASTKVLSVDEEWEELDLRSADTEDLLRRFTNRSRSEYTEKSLAVYRQRFLKSVGMYLAYLDGDEWRPRNGRTPAAGRNGNGRNGAAKQAPTKFSASETAELPAAPSTAAPTTPSAPPVAELEGLIEYPFPVRPGLRARLVLPDDLTAAEADRVAAFIKTLAFDSPAE